MPMLRFGRRRRQEGTLRLIANFESPQLGNTRDLHLYLPPGYDTDGRSYPVIYLQDGQNLFSDASSFSGAWHVQDAADAAARLGYPAIIVGIANAGPARINEYSPFIDAEIGGGQGDDYLAFLIESVKRRIDEEFRTLPDPDNTVIGGSSMGGLIALYAYFRHPEVFGATSVQSPALWFAGGALFDYVARTPARRGRVYLDVGKREGDATLMNARRIHEELLTKGYVDRLSMLYVEDWRGVHHEFAWGRRLKKALPFLLELEHK